MRTLKQVSLAVVLTVMLGTCAMAGIIDTPPSAPPPPQPPSATATGIIECPPSAAAASVPTPSNLVVDLALNLLQSALSVF